MNLFWPFDNASGGRIVATDYIDAPQWPTWQPRACEANVHVFPCSHCDMCECGHATIKRKKSKGAK